VLLNNGVLFYFQTRLPNIRVHAYFAPVTPPASVGGSRQRYCKCCVILWWGNVYNLWSVMYFINKLIETRQMCKPCQVADQV